MERFKSIGISKGLELGNSKKGKKSKFVEGVKGKVRNSEVNELKRFFKKIGRIED